MGIPRRGEAGLGDRKLTDHAVPVDAGLLEQLAAQALLGRLARVAAARRNLEEVLVPALAEDEQLATTVALSHDVREGP